MKKIILMLLAGAFCIKGNAQTTTPDTAVTNFVTNATKGGLMEINSGKLAAKKGKSETVKGYRKQMVTDHSKANAELKSIVTAKKWEFSNRQ